MVDSYRYEQNDIICYPLSRCRRVHGTPTLTLSNFRPTMGRKVNFTVGQELRPGNDDK